MRTRSRLSEWWRNRGWVGTKVESLYVSTIEKEKGEKKNKEENVEKQSRNHRQEKKIKT